MNIILNDFKFIIPTVISASVAFYTISLNKKIQKLNRQHQRKSELNKPQNAILFIIQNMIGDKIKIKNELSIENKIMKFMEHETYEKIFNVELFKQAQYALYSEIFLSTCSEKVMAIVLRIQEVSYATERKKDIYYPVVLYSLLYKYLYLDFTENEIDDFYLLRYNLNDFYENVEIFKEKKTEIYLDLINKHDWKKLKN